MAGSKRINIHVDEDPVETGIPCSLELDKLADEIIEEIESSTRPVLERAGMLGLAILFKQSSSGALTDRQTFKLLNDLFQHKTPAPVQRLEASVSLDMGALLREAIAANRSSMEKLDARAAAGKLEVMERYGLDETLELPERSLEGKVGDSVVEYGEPDELIELRRKGD